MEPEGSFTKIRKVKQILASTNSHGAGPVNTSRTAKTLSRSIRRSNGVTIQMRACMMANIHISWWRNLDTETGLKVETGDLHDYLFFSSPGVAT
jgi:hypothetical protein